MAGRRAPKFSIGLSWRDSLLLQKQLTYQAVGGTDETKNRKHAVPRLPGKGSVWAFHLLPTQANGLIIPCETMNMLFTEVSIFASLHLALPLGIRHIVYSIFRLTSSNRHIAYPPCHPLHRWVAGRHLYLDLSHNSSRASSNSKGQPKRAFIGPIWLSGAPFRFRGLVIMTRYNRNNACGHDQCHA